MTIADATPELDILDRNDRAFLGHPKGLAYLAFTEAWERFSYYGMQTLLALYLVQVLLLPGHVENIAFFASFRQIPYFYGLDGQPLASHIFGAYTALVYLTPIFGGLIADRWLGKRLAVLIGAVVMAMGHFLMAFEVSFLFALLCLIIGCGLIKGNLASQVGTLYKPADLRRADAFQIYYLGINAGVIISPLIVGTLGQSYGWHWGFGAAGVGMLISLCIYIAGQKYLPVDHVRRSGHPVTTAAESGDTTPAPSKLTRADLPALAAVILLIPVMALSIVPNNQIFNVYLVWGDAHFSLEFFGMHFLSSWLVTIDAIVSVSFIAIVALFYRWYGMRHREPDELTKIIIGSLFSVAGMLCLAAAALTTPAGAKISMFWPMMFELLNSIGFAHMLPVSLALFARLAPRPLHATVIGLYYLSFFAANAMVGWIGGYYAKWSTTSFWLVHAALAGGAGLAFLVFKLTLAPRLMPNEAARSAP